MKRVSKHAPSAEEKEPSRTDTNATCAKEKDGYEPHKTMQQMPP